MKAERIDGKAVNGARRRLAEMIPLDTPYAVTIFPIYACNFKCNYCVHAIPLQERESVCKNVIMDFELYKKCIDDFMAFPHKLKALHFAGLGEPLLHPQIVDMVKYAADKGVAEVIDIITNGILLEHQLSLDLVAAGLSKIRISLQGLSAEQYKKTSAVDINYDKFYQNIEYFYQHKKNTSVYIKIMDVCLEDGEESVFVEKFTPIADSLAVEHLCPLVDTIDYKEKEYIYTINGNIMKNVEVCPQPFYTLQINPDGDCIPCCTVEKPIVVGNCLNETIQDIWNGDKMKSFRKKQLLKEKDAFSACKRCAQYKYGMFPEDILDDDTEKILQRL